MSLSPALSHALTAWPDVWRGDEIGAADAATVMASGHAALDAQLPGGGWPVGALTELLQAQPEAHAWRLLLPALAARVRALSAPVALIGAPFEPFGPALAAQGLPLEDLLWVRSSAASARLWACEQALRCGEVAAVLAWLPQVRVGDLRRLQLAAAQHDALLFVFRPETAAQGASPARLRLHLSACPHDSSQIDVQLLKRRGPPLTGPVQLPAQNQRMAALLAAGQWRRKARRAEQGAVVAPPSKASVVRLGLRPVPAADGGFTFEGGSDALDRVAVAA